MRHGGDDGRLSGRNEGGSTGKFELRSSHTQQRDKDTTSSTWKQMNATTKEPIRMKPLINRPARSLRRGIRASEVAGLKDGRARESPHQRQRLHDVVRVVVV